MINYENEVTQYINVIRAKHVELPKCSQLLLAILSLDIFPISSLVLSGDNFHSFIALIFFLFPIRLKSRGRTKMCYFTPKTQHGACHIRDTNHLVNGWIHKWDHKTGRDHEGHCFQLSAFLYIVPSDYILQLECL